MNYCKNNHTLTDDNLYTFPSNGWTTCHTCVIESNRRSRAKKTKSELRDVRKRSMDNHRFSGNREATIERDGNKCVGCGLSRREHQTKYGTDITVDHIDGTGRGTSKQENNNSLDNLQTLCLSCHGKKDEHRKNTARGERQARAKLKESDVLKIHKLYVDGMSQKNIAAEMDTTPENVYCIVHGKTWKHLLNTEGKL